MSRDKHLVVLAVSVLTLSRPAVAADQCELLAAKIAHQTGMVTSPRVPANFIPMTQPDGDYGAHLECNGSHGLTLQAISPPAPPEDWFQFFAQAASALTGDAPSADYAATKKCQAKAEHTSDGFADLSTGTPPVVCDLDGSNLEVFIWKK